jgi:hypothetical protein
MAKRMSEANEREFAELERFLRFFSTHIKGIAEDNRIHPSNVLQEIISKYGKSKALAGLRQAVNDSIEQTQHYLPEQVGALDKRCMDASVLTLSELRRRYWRKYKAMLERGNIKNDTEYYLAVGILNDSATSITASERNQLSDLAAAYERRAA